VRPEGKCEGKATFHIWILDKNGNRFIAPGKKAKEMEKKWQKISYNFSEFKQHPKGNASLDLEAADKILLGCNFGSFVLYADDISFYGKDLLQRIEDLKKPKQIILSVNTEKIYVKQFLGFGAEWDSRGYVPAGITDKDFSLIQKRVEWMRLPIARIMMQSKWCYKGKGKYDWSNKEMKALYRHLDVCEKLGTTVLLSDWGIEPSWLKCPDVAHVEDPKYAEIIGTYMDHLLNKKKYSCIKYFIMVNEPNYEVKDWNRWKKGIQNVYKEFQKRGLTNKVKIAGSDHSNNDSWHWKAVNELKSILGAYDIHRYTRGQELLDGKLNTYYLKSWQYALVKDPEAKTKPMIVGEAGVWTRGTGASQNPMHMDFEYGVKMADYAVQAVNAGSWAVLAWMLDDNSHIRFTWGMWKSKAEEFELKPWFYTWALLCRYFPPGSEIFQIPTQEKRLRILCARIPDPKGKDKWTFCLVNRGRRDLNITLTGPDDSAGSWKHFLYSTGSQKKDSQGFPVPAKKEKGTLNKGITTECPVNSVVIVTSLGY
ncbi:hypothetical protein ACFL6F_03825, partial [Planctomycetota bacterium]